MGVVNPSGGGGEWDLISETTISAATSFTLSSIPAGYKNLQLLISGERSDSAFISMQLNGDTGANYDYQYLLNYNVTVSSGKNTGQTAIYIEAGSDGNGYWASNILLFWDGTLRNRCISHSGGTTCITKCIGSQNSTTAITSIKCNMSGGKNFSDNTRIVLLGRS